MRLEAGLWDVGVTESSEVLGVLGRGGPDRTGPECRWPFNGLAGRPSF